MISTRVQFASAFVATLVGIVGLASYGFHALDQVADGATEVRRELDLLRSTAWIEDTLRDLAAGPAGGDALELVPKLDARIAALHEYELPSEQRTLLEAFDRAVGQARERPSPETWFKAGQAIGAVEQSLIRRSRWADTEVRAGGRARRLLLMGGGVVAVFALASAVVFIRKRREDRVVREHVRRSDHLAALGTVAASVAHEINNPLATIAGCASAVRERMHRDPAASADLLEYLEMIEDETRRCSGIVKGLRDLARDGPAAMAPADVAKLTRNVVALVQMDRQAKPVVFVVRGEQQLDAICDPDKFKQLLLNLLLNARDASAPGGTVTVNLERVGADDLRLEVRDEGRGIERRDLQRIFEPFHTDKAKGLGIGLFLCDRIVAVHGGTIRAESEGPDRGARFVVELPRRTGPDLPRPAQVAAAPRGSEI